MDSQGLDRLREEQILAIDQSNEKINQLKTFKEDYESLQNRLQTLPDKINHNIMVPFGPLAFMPGQLIHTNEVLVLLGDNWFADRSVKQSVDIISRRIKAIDQQILEVEKQKNLIAPRLEFTSELKNISEGRSDVVEINEEQTEEEYRASKEKHRQSVRLHRQQLRRKALTKNQETQSTEADKSQKGEDEEWFMKRLEQLELQETKHYERNVSSESGEPRSDDSNEDESQSSEEEEDNVSIKKVRWKDEHEKRPSSLITFTHTKANTSEEEKRLSDSSVEVTSPADVVKLFTSTNTPQSILKSYGHQSQTFGGSIVEKDIFPNPVCKTTLNQEEPHSAILQPHYSNQPSNVEKDSGVHHPVVEAFSGSVIEKDILPNPVSKTAISQEDPAKPTKRVSKFKASRQPPR